MARHAYHVTRNVTAWILWGRVAPSVAPAAVCVSGRSLAIASLLPHRKHCRAAHRPRAALRLAGFVFLRVCFPFSSWRAALLAAITPGAHPDTAAPDLCTDPWIPPGGWRGNPIHAFNSPDLGAQN